MGILMALGIIYAIVGVIIAIFACVAYVYRLHDDYVMSKMLTQADLQDTTPLTVAKNEV